MIIVFAWFIAGTLIGVLGVFITSMVPFFGLGLILAIAGVITHSIDILLGKKLPFWQGGIIVAFVSSTISIIAGTMAGNHFNFEFILFFLSYYLVFGTLLYLIIGKYIIRLVS